VETRGNVENRVIGAATVGTDEVNSSVGKNMPGAAAAGLPGHHRGVGKVR
jgi:hypothetical protein